MATRQPSIGFASTPGNGNRFRLSGADIYAICISFPVTLGLGWTLVHEGGLLTSSWKIMLVWLSALIVLNLLDLPNTYGLKLAPDLPVSSVLAVFFAPGMAACMAFVGSCDRREFTGAIRPTTTLFNRSQVALSIFFASLAAHAVAGPDSAIPILAAQTTLALAVSLCFNYLLVDLMSSLTVHVPPWRAVAMMRLGRPWDFSATIIAWATMAFLLAAAYEVASGWAVVAFCIPAVMGRQVLARSQQLMNSEAALETKQEAVRELSELSGIERRDERLMISSHLHDDVLQPLFQVSLLCSVVKEDLANGMLLSLEEDVPVLKEACDHASGVLRRFIDDLRNSPLGSRGLPETITGLVRDTSTANTSECHLDSFRRRRPARKRPTRAVSSRKGGPAERRSPCTSQAHLPGYEPGRGIHTCGDFRRWSWL